MRFYVDESAMGLGKCLAVARPDTVHPGHRRIPQCPAGSLDTEWIPVVAGLGLVVICRDKKLRTKPAEILALTQAGLRVLCIGGKKDLPTWEWLVRVVKHWDRIESTIERMGSGPWIFMLNESAVVQFWPKPDGAS